MFQPYSLDLFSYYNLWQLICFSIVRSIDFLELDDTKLLDESFDYGRVSFHVIFCLEGTCDMTKDYFGVSSDYKLLHI